MLSEEDTKIFYVTDDIDETVGILKDQYLGRTESVITDDKNPK